MAIGDEGGGSTARPAAANEGHFRFMVDFREGEEEGREFKSDRVAFANHLPGVHKCSVVYYIECTSLRPTHGLDRSRFFVFFCLNRVKRDQNTCTQNAENSVTGPKSRLSYVIEE